MPRRVEPAVRNVIEVRRGAFGEGAVANLFAAFGQAMPGVLAVGRLERAAKLLASTLQQPVVFFQTIRD